MNTTTLNMTTLDGGVIIKKGGGGTPTPPSGGESSEKYYLLDWENIDQEEGYEREVALNLVKILDMVYYTAYVMPNKGTLTGTAVILSSEENWGPWLYKAMRWRDSETDADAEAGGLSPKEFMGIMGGDIPFAVAMVERMTECTEEEFYALTK